MGWISWISPMVAPWNPPGIVHAIHVYSIWNPWWGWNEEIAEDPPKGVPYGIHGMDGGIHPFHMEYTGECKDLDGAQQTSIAACRNTFHT